MSAALGNASLFVDVTSTLARTYLADVDQSHAGQTMFVDLYDLGDTPAGDAFVQLLAPPAGAPGIVPTTGTEVASAYSLGTDTIGGPTPNTASTCTIQTRMTSSGSGVYNDKWLRIAVPIPADYSCTTDCWWSLAFSYTAAQSSDRMVVQVTFQ